MKKRILSILLLCCMVLTLLPTAAFAADELPDVKLSVPTKFDKTVDLTKQNGELKIKDSNTYLIKGSTDPNWYFQHRIKIDGKRKKITPHIFLDGVRLKAPKDGPAIELYEGASACLYFIGNDSELIGAENFAALQKNKTDGYLRVLVQTGTKLTCEGGKYGAGIGGSKVGIKNFSQGHGVNLHFGSLATNIYGGEILAISGVYGAGIGGGQGGVGEWIYVYSGKLTVRSVSEGAGIGGGQGGPGRFIYIKGGTVNAGSESGGAGIGSGDQDGQNKPEDAHHIEISGGTVEAWSNYAGAGIGGGRDGSGYDISITGGVVRAQGYFGAGIGGGMNGNSGNILIKDTTLTALAGPLYPSSDYNYQPASAVGRGSNRVHYQVVMQDQEFAMSIEENIKIGASNGKSVWLSATGWQWRHNQEPKKYWYWDTTTELLIPNENGRVDLQRLSLPYAYNYGRVISELELRCEESTCSHEFVWANRDGCHIWACKNCGARDPAAEMSKQNGKHIPGDWGVQEMRCAVCDHLLEKDTKAPVLEVLKDGESYTVEDNIDGNPGAYTFTVSDPAASGETSSGIKSVTINGEPQDGPTYRLPAPDGGNNDAGAEYTVVATDNAGNKTTATVRTYRRHHYTITFDTAGGSTVAPITQDYGTNITAPAAPTREGYTFIGWDKAIPATMPAENMTITAKWKVNQYTITFDTAGGSAVAPITQNYGTAIVAPESPTREGYTFIGWDKTIPTTMPAENMTIKARWKDIEKPTGEIIIGTNKWSEFLNELTYGLFFKDTQTVTINASDNSGIVFVSYLVTDQDLSEAELKSLVYRAYEEPFRIEPNGEYIVYVMLVDASLNITYLRSDRITLDNVQPVIDGIENGKTYCEAQTVTINEKYIDTVTVNGTAVTLDENGSFALSPANGKQKIVVTDKAGNTAEMTVTVNDGHTLLADDNDCTTPVYCKFCNAEVIAAKSHRFTENWQNDETAHWHICQNENCTVTDTKTAHSGDDDGNCLTAVVCECGYVITAAKPAHMFNEWTSNGNGTHTRKCTGVGCNCIETVDCSGGKATCTEQAVCTVCHTGYGDALGHNFTIAQHDETHHWNKCSRCDATDAKAVHTGGTATCREKAVCEVCRSAYGKLSAANHVGGTEIRDAKPHSCIENGYTGDTYCKGCGEKLSSGTVIHADGHKGGTATCTDKAECEVCHEKYGEPDANHHTGLETVDAVPATAVSTGTAAHWRCTACGKLFADADGKQEIRSEDTVTKKLAPSILDGANSEWRKGDENGLTFSSDAVFSDFVEVLVDGKTVASENYERQDSGTIVELKASYLETLAEGEHTLTIRSASGDATTRFTIAASDSTNAWVWIIIGFIALGIGVTVAVFVVRKRKTAKSD